MKIFVFIFWSLAIFETFYPLKGIIFNAFGISGIIAGYLLSVAGFICTGIMIYRNRGKFDNIKGSDFKLD